MPQAVTAECGLGVGPSSLADTHGGLKDGSNRSAVRTFDVAIMSAWIIVGAARTCRSGRWSVCKPDLAASTATHTGEGTGSPLRRKVTNNVYS